MNRIKELAPSMNYTFITAIISFACMLASCETMKQNRHQKKHIDTANTSVNVKLPSDIESKILAKILEESCNTCIPPLCAENACQEELCQQTIRNCHSNTSLQMQSKIQQFTGGVIPEPKVISSSVIDSLLTVANCSSNDLIQLCANFDIKNSNTDIVIGINPMSENPLCLEMTKSINESIEYIADKLIDDEKTLNKTMLMLKIRKAFVKYSHAMLSGVKQLEPVAYHFYKAKSMQHEPGNCEVLVLKKDIVFVAVDAQGQVLFCGDVSDLFP